MNTRALHFLRIICLALLWPALVTAQSRFIEVDKIVAGDKGTYDEFGSSVSISGDYAIVGAFCERRGSGRGNTKEMSTVFIFPVGLAYI